MAQKPKPISFNEFIDTGAAKAKKKPAGETITVRVKATRLGYAGLKRRREGDEFTVTLPKGAKLPSWMTPVDGTEIEVAPVPATQENAGLDATSTTSAPSASSADAEAGESGDADAVI